MASLTNPSPLNCVNFDLEGQLVAVGCWDGAVRLWNWLEQKNVTVGNDSKDTLLCLIYKTNFSPNSFFYLDSVRSSEFGAESVFLSLLLHVVLRLSVRRSAALVSDSSCLCGQLSCSPRLHTVTKLPAGRKTLAECWP